jgi:hypothetical protein
MGVVAICMRPIPVLRDAGRTYPEGAWTPGPPCVTLPPVGLGDLGARVRLIDTGGDDLGLAHLPRPVEPGDLAALQQGFPLRVVAVVELELGGAVDVLAEVEAAPICLTN